MDKRRDGGGRAGMTAESMINDALSVDRGADGKHTKSAIARAMGITKTGLGKKLTCDRNLTPLEAGTIAILLGLNLADVIGAWNQWSGVTTADVAAIERELHAVRPLAARVRGRTDPYEGKDAALRRVDDGERVAVVASSLGMDPGTLYRWIRQAAA